MAARDIMPWISPQGGILEVRYGAMTAGELFEIGEPVNVVTAGTLTEPPDDASAWAIADFTTAGIAGLNGGIACFGPGGGNINPMTGVAFATGDLIAYWPINQGILFKTQNFFAAAAGADATPALTDIGESYEITYNTTATIGWGVEQDDGTAGTDVQALVHDVLDARNTSVHHPLYDGTAVWVVFEIYATETAT